MGVEIVTKEDLRQFRMELLSEIRQLIQMIEPKEERPWLKNNDVKKLLRISSNTVQRLRIAGKLKSTKIGGIHYYRQQDIEALLQGGYEKEGV